MTTSRSETVCTRCGRSAALVVEGLDLRGVRVPSSTLAGRPFPLPGLGA